MAARIIMSIVCLCLAPHALAKKSRFFLAPASPLPAINDQSSDVKAVGFRLPCGAEYEGIVIKKLAKDRLGVAVIYRSPMIACTSQSQRQIQSLPFIDADRHSLEPLRARVGTRKLILNEAIEARVVTSDEGQTSVQMVHGTSCGKAVGTILKPSLDGRLIVGAAEIKPKKRRGTCPYEEKVQDVDFIADAYTDRVEPYEKPSKKKHRKFALVEAKIDRQSLKRDAYGVSVRYQRQCNEAPIGMVVSQPRHTDSEPSVRVGVLLAHYPQWDCQEELSEPQWDTLHNSDLHIPRNWKVFFSAEAKPSELQLISPSQYEVKKGGIDFGYLQNCGTFRGFVYAKDILGRRSVGVLKRVGAEECQRPIREVSHFQPFVRHLEADYYPMKVKGQQVQL